MIHRSVIKICWVAIAYVGWILPAEQVHSQDAAVERVRQASDDTVAFVIDQAQVVRIQDTLIASPIAGTVQEVTVVEGDLVRKGQTLVQLDATRASQELVAAKASLRAATIQAENNVNTRYAERTLEVREREMEQSKEANLRYAGSVTATEIDRLQLVIDQAQLSVEQAQQEAEVAAASADEKSAAVGLAQLRVDEHRITTRVDGRIAEMAVQSGQWIEAGTPVARIVSLDPIRVSAFVDGRTHDRVLVGRNVEFVWEGEGMTGDSGDRAKRVRLRGRVTFVSDELNPISSQVRLWAELANPNEWIRPGMRGVLVILKP